MRDMFSKYDNNENIGARDDNQSVFLAIKKKKKIDLYVPLLSRSID